jgi:hypothetical protein
VLWVLLLSNFSFGTLVALLKKGGFDFQHELLEVVRQTLPLTAGMAVISVLVGFWLLEKPDSLGTLFVLVVGMLDLSGYAGTLLSGRMVQFHAAYASWFDLLPSSGPYILLLKGVAYSVLSVVGFYEAYGARNFFASLVIGAAAPWVTLYAFKRKYEAAEKKAAAQAEEGPG